MTTTLAPVARGARATTAGALLVVRRRARTDTGLLALSAVVLAVTVALVLLLPRVVAGAADQAVHQAVADAGPAADLVARVGSARAAGFGSTASSTRDPNVAAELRDAATDVHDALPAAARAATDAGTVMMGTQTVRGRIGATTLTTRVVYVGLPDEGRQAGLVTWVRGVAPAAARLPADDGETTPRHEVQVGMQVDAARRFGVQPGDRARLGLSTFGPVDFVVTGLYTAPHPGDRAWAGAPDLLGARDVAAGGTEAGHAALLLTDASLPDAALVVQSQALQRQLRFAVSPALVGTGSAGAVRDAVAATQSDPSGLTRVAGGNVTLDSTLPATLDAVTDRLVAARAQQSVLVLGLGGVGVLVLVLAARLLVTRRESLLAAERARGASILSVVVRALLESAPLTVLAGGLGVLAAHVVAGRAALPADDGGTTLAAVLVVLAALAPAVAAALQVRTAFAGRRAPANRADRDRLARRRRARRTVAEVGVVALAVGAIVSVRSRGLAQTSTGGVDLLLAATPLLVAAAATLVVARLLPPVLRALSRAARRGRGLVPVVATARASAATGTAVPLLTLTVAVALVVFCGTTVLTVDAGQQAAADARVGADVRVESTAVGSLTSKDVTDLRARPGVTAVAGIAVLGSRSLGRSTGTTADLVLVDADRLAAIETAHGRADGGLAHLTQGDRAHPAGLVSTSLASAVALVPPQVATDSGPVTLAVVGTAGDEPRVRVDHAGPAPRGRVLLDRAVFDAAQGKATDPTTILLDGPGARAAARSLADRPGVTVIARDAWLTTWRASPVNHDLVALLLGAAGALAAYAALALVLMVAATARERGRSLSALRTLGLDRRTGAALTFGELAPVAIASVVAGTVIGLGIPWLTSAALGLDRATGGFGAPALQVGWWPALGAVAVTVLALAVAVAVERVARRRDRLGEVLRVGER